MTGILSTVAIVLTIIICFAMFIAQSRIRQIKFINQKFGPNLQSNKLSDPIIPKSPTNKQIFLIDKKNKEFQGKNTFV